MQITTKATGVELTPEILAYAEKRLEAFTKLIKTENVLCNLELGRTTLHHQSGNIYRAEVNLTVDGTMLRAEATGETLNAAIDEVHDEIVRDLRNLKRKRIHLLKQGGAKVKAFLHGDTFKRFRR